MATESENRATDTISARVSKETKARLDSLCKQNGYSLNTLAKMVFECLVRFMDDQHNLSEDLRRVIRMFEGLPGWKKAFNLADGWDGVEIIEAFYVLGKKGKQGNRIAHVIRPMLQDDVEGWTVSYNTQHHLERFMEVSNPSLYRLLRLISVELGNESLWDTLHSIVTQYRDNPDEEELRLQFEQNDLHYGQRMHEAMEAAKNRKRSHNPSDPWGDTSPLFDKDDGDD